MKNVVTNIRTGEIQHELIARLSARASGKVQHPVRVLAVQIAVRVDHLRFYPEAEVHAEGMDLVDEWLEAVRELLRVHVPVAEACMVVVSLAKPAVVHDESLDADTGCLLGERLLSGLIDAEGGRLP